MYYIIGSLIIICLIILFIVLTKKDLKALRIQIDNSFYDLDHYLEKRFDLSVMLTSIINTTFKNNRDIIDDFMKIKAKILGAISDHERLIAEKELSSILHKIYETSNTYPELAQNRNFTKIIQELNNLEKEISDYKDKYNEIIKSYNHKVSSFPTKFIANIYHFKAQPKCEL